MNKRNVLVFPAGSAIGLEISQALKYCKEIRLYGGGQNILNHARFTYGEYHHLPSIYETGWVNELDSLCERLHINYIFPAYDDVIVALRQNEQRLHAKIIGSPLTTCEIARSKSATYRILASTVRVPAVYADTDSIPGYPVLVKPDKGQGSQGVMRCGDLESVRRAVSAVKEPIICEYLPGDEYTIDCFSDRDKGLLFAGARRRRQVMNGISVNSLTEQVPELQTMAEKISSTLTLRGAWFFQVKRAATGEFALLEIAPRISGTMAAHRVMGVNFPLLSIFEEERFPITIQINPGAIEINRALTNRYHHSISYRTLYIDLDDTLLLNSEVNPMAVKLVYQCINKNKKVVLLTRHRGDVHKTLNKFRLQQLFDCVIEVAEGQKKSAYITEQDAIYVDDSFSERMDVAKVCKIPTFDCSMIELLTEQAESLNGAQDV